ncbi:flagellar basal body L-ring protein FlgH [Methylocystis sp. WRRC1]|uniref:flagellar basal body L-ring protein FlgH n=1 Tax=unclassified Methylocystis TaxID=2625913 RepID=UPI0001F879E9|nr:MULTISPECIES: flagellar basal body L-ring protein FlgH [unclassified Methylocystis]MCC3245292.1 flagellar basal body L-ring protein FlgH [Methylocystis sp. WRRC1]
MKKTALLCLSAALLTGCATDPRDFTREPHMTPVGSGLNFHDDQIPVGALQNAVLGPGMRIDENRVNLFHDIRAMNVGDVVTVVIEMNDRAILGNSTDRSREAKIKSKWTFLLDLVPMLGGPTNSQTKQTGAWQNDIDSSTETQGQGTINRSEQIRFTLAAVVTAVLPNGNLVLHGSQEIRVNQELRVLSIGGVARPRDINKDNSINYDKIAEARVSYGGRGRLTEVQQPAWGQQLYDTFVPF